MAKALNGEIISVDSRQIYKELDIGSAKPALEEREGIVHHLIDVVNVTDEYTAADFCDAASYIIDDIIRRGKFPILAGGTGLYFRILLQDFDLPRVAPDKKLREELEQKTSIELYDMLLSLDYDAAQKIHFNNKVKIIRALEVCKTLGIPMSRAQKKKESKYQTLWVGLNSQNRDFLYNRINNRVEIMFEKGLIKEAENLFKRITNIFRFQLFSIGNDLFDVSVYDKSHITKSTYVVISKTDGKHHFSVSGVRRQIELSKFLETDCRGFENLIQQLTISKLTNFQKRVLLAVDFLGLATRNIGQPSGFVHAITAIETLLSMGKMGISQNIADNYAFIMGTDLENRKTLKQDTKKLYRIRSELAHGEKSIISVEDCKDAISHAYALILKFLFDDKLRHIQNNEQFVEYIENIKFADKREEI